MGGPIENHSHVIPQISKAKALVKSVLGYPPNLTNRILFRMSISSLVNAEMVGTPHHKPLGNGLSIGRFEIYSLPFEKKLML